MKCPGQDTKYWKPGAIFEVMCPKCEKEVEFFKDDTSRKCGHCGHRFVNPQMDFGCAAYCQFAEQCMGALPDEIKSSRETALKDVVAVEMKRYFKTDFKRIGHAVKVAGYAERLGKEAMGNLAVILIAAYLHDIGYPEAEKKYGDEAALHHEKEGAVIAKGILEKVGAQKKLVDMVLDVIAHHHHPSKDATLELKIVYDADLMVNMEAHPVGLPDTKDEITSYLETKFLTDSAREIARTVLFEEKAS